MDATGFKQSSSIVGHLKIIMISISIFFVLGFLGIYLSSTESLRGLQTIQAANEVLGLVSQAQDGLGTSAKYVSKVQIPLTVISTEISFRESQTQVRKILSMALDQVERFDDARDQLLSARTAMANYEASALDYFDGLRRLPPVPAEADLDEVNSEVLIANQFALEADEALRKAQISLRSLNGETFKEIFRNRYLPLYVATALSGLFFVFVLTVGLGITRRLSDSILNLTRATDQVGQGNLVYEAPIIERDEIGNLTFEFNHMVRSLRVTVDHVTRLQSITAAFSEALSMEQVFEVILTEGRAALQATAGMVTLLNPTDLQLETKKVIGGMENVDRDWSRFPLDTPAPLAEAVRSKTPIYIESLEELIRRYPMFETVKGQVNRSIACIPLLIGSEALGGLAFQFESQKVFSEAERDFILALSQQCAQAIHRVQLFEDTKLAVRARDEFLSIASHELKTPLTPLRLQFQLLEKQFSQELTSLNRERILTLVKKSDQQITRLTRLIEDLLDVSRITAGKLALHLEAGSLTETVRSVVENYRAQLSDLQSDIELVPASDVQGVFDKLRIEQVVTNLITNASKYAPRTPIKVEVKLLQGRGRIEVHDQGPGIEPEHQKRIFERFERVQDRDNIGGLGLGLYISRQIVEAHQGSIHVNSELGKGSSFVVEVPLTAGPVDLAT